MTNEVRHLEGELRSNYPANRDPDTIARSLDAPRSRSTPSRLKRTVLPPKKRPNQPPCAGRNSRFAIRNSENTAPSWQVATAQKTAFDAHFMQRHYKAPRHRACSEL
jgi:hypothetical protein